MRRGRPMRRRGHRRWVRASLSALAVAAAWALGLWLIVLGSFSAVVVLGRRRFRARQRLPVRLVAWALHAPHGLSPPVALEHAVAVDLAVISEGHLDRLDRAQVVLADCVDDPWRRGLGAERLTMAQDVIERGRLVGVMARREPTGARVRLSAAAVVLIVLVAVGNTTQSPWWLLPLAAVHAVLTLQCLDLYECRRGIPQLLASRSLQDPIRGVFVMPEREVARSLVVLAGNDPVIIQRALSLLQQADAHEHAHARLRLIHAECLAAGEQNAGRRKAG